MKILYGVVGEGMGHAMRSRVVLSHLVSQGHDIEIMASGRATEFLKKHFDGVNKIHGLHMIYEENRMRLGKTVLSNVLEGATALPRNIAAYFDLVRAFQPEVAISDFESWTYLYAKTHRLPILSVDNMQVLNRCTHGSDVIQGDDAAFHLARTFVKSKLPFCDAYFITTFFRPPIRKAKTQLFPPILRPEILAAHARRGDHLLVYQTAEGHEALTEALSTLDVECRVYGIRRDLREDVREGNLLFRPFSEAGFIDDLATCRGVVASGGFTLMGEAVYLRKPMLAVPVQGQFEQVLNARYLEKEGFGMHAVSLDAETVRAFLDRLPACEQKLAEYTQNGNHDIMVAIDQFLDQAAAGLV